MILVLGGKGFIGENVCRALVHSGKNVVSFDREGDTHIQGVCAVSGDFFDDEELFQHVDKADVIIHAISTISTNNASEVYMRGYEKDLIQTIKLFEYASKSNKRVIFLSSGGTVYGNPLIIPTPEDVCQNPISHYGAIKLCAEKVAQVFNRQYGNNIICLRLANPYGPGQDFTKGIGFIDAVLRKAITQETLSIWGDGSIVRDYVHIEDVVEIIKFFCDYRGEETIFNVGTGIGVSQNQIIDIAKNMGLHIDVSYVEARSVDVQANVLDCTRLMRVYCKKMKKLEEGMREYYDYLVQRQ